MSNLSTRRVQLSREIVVSHRVRQRRSQRHKKNKIPAAHHECLDQVRVQQVVPLYPQRQALRRPPRAALAPPAWPALYPSARMTTKGVSRLAMSNSLSQKSLVMDQRQDGEEG